jgi:hypothetical protein
VDWGGGAAAALAAQAHTPADRRNHAPIRRLAPSPPHPHPTSAPLRPGEDLKKIQQGTWVAWKMPGDSAAAGGPLYVDDTFYNFLLPQRPATV